MLFDHLGVDITVIKSVVVCPNAFNKLIDCYILFCWEELLKPFSYETWCGLSAYK